MPSDPNSKNNMALSGFKASKMKSFVGKTK